jgi:hypothetical protein
VALAGVVEDRSRKVLHGLDSVNARVFGALHAFRVTGGVDASVGLSNRITTTQRYMNARVTSLAESMRRARKQRFKRLEDAGEASVQIG